MGWKHLGLLMVLWLAAVPMRADDWPQWRGPGRDGVWHETGLVERLPEPQIPIRWRAEISSGYCGPTVAAGRVYVMDRVEQPEERERVHAFDWTDGRELWTHSYPTRYGEVSYPAGPRASVTIDDGRAYSLGTVGQLFCLDAVNGSVLWQKDLAKEYEIRIPIWGVAAAPLIEGDSVIVQAGAGNGACLVAFDKRTGAERWKALDDEASYSAPIVIQQAGRRVLVCWTGDRLVGLEPSSGQVYWESPFKHERWVEAIATPVVDGDRLFVSCFQDGSLMVRLDPEKLAIQEIWRRHGPDEQHTDSVHSLISTPYLKGDYVYAVDAYGPLLCLAAATGDRVWENTTATSQIRWGTLHMVQNGDKTWIFNDRGELIISRLSPQGFEEISRSKLIRPTTGQLRRRDGVCWSHPAYAYRHVFARNDEELVCASLAAEESK
jgi:outer membrane protein assembly factor BamB